MSGHFWSTFAQGMHGGPGQLQLILLPLVMMMMHSHCINITLAGFPPGVRLTGKGFFSPSLSYIFFFFFIYCPCSVRFGQRHGRLCNIAKVWTLSTLLGDCPTLMDSHLHNLKGGTYVSKKLVGRSIPRLAKKAFHSNGVTLTSPPQQTQLLQHSP